MLPEVAFGIVLRRLRSQCGLSQEAVAHDAGIERNYISLLELGRNSVSLKMIFKLALALKVSVAEMMVLVENELESNRPREK